MKPSQLAEALSSNLNPPLNETLHSDNYDELVDELGERVNQLFIRIYNLPESLEKVTQAEDYHGPEASVEDPVVVFDGPIEGGRNTTVVWVGSFDIPVEESVALHALTSEQLVATGQLTEKIELSLITRIFTADSGQVSAEHELLSKTELDSELGIDPKDDKVDVEDAILNTIVYELTDEDAFHWVDQALATLLFPDSLENQAAGASVAWEGEETERDLAVDRLRKLPAKDIIEGFDIPRLEEVVTTLEAMAKAA